MSGITLTPTNILHFFSSLSPILITSYLLLDSVFNTNVKGIIYIFGLAVSMMCGLFLKKIIGRKDEDLIPEGESCSIFKTPFFEQSAISKTPSLRAMFHMFTASYIGAGVLTNPHATGLPFFVVLLIISILDFLTRLKNGCEKMEHLMIGSIFGIFFGLSYWAAVFYGWPGPKYTYYGKEDDVNNERCMLNKKLTWKCSYKK